MKTKQLIALIVCTLFSCLTVSAASANSAQKHWSGVDSSGALITDTDCPITVESELLTFDIRDLPKSYYNDAEELAAYSASVTAQYTFYNPADYTVTARLEFPFGKLPSYAGNNYSYNGEDTLQDDTNRYGITVNGEAAESTVRHTFSHTYSQFELEKDLPLLVDGYKKDAFFTPELAVTKYIFEITDYDTDSRAANAAFDVEPFNGQRKILFLGESGFHTQTNGNYRLSEWAEKGKQLTVYVFGELFSEFPEWKFYEDGGVKDGEEISGAVKRLLTEQMTFEEFAFSDFQEFPEDANILKADWYNAVIDDLNSCENGSTGVIMYNSYSLFTNSLMRWYEYEITLAPGERIVNTVTAPIYPAIDAEYSPEIFTYTYLLSPAQSWAEFGTLDIVINTPFYLIKNDTFEKTDTGYKLSLDGLPDGELEFLLCSSEEPEGSPGFSKISSGFVTALIFAVPIFVIVLIIVVITGIVKQVRRKG